MVNPNPVLQFIFICFYEYLELMMVLLILENICGASFTISRKDAIILAITNTCFFALSAIFIKDESSPYATLFQPLVFQVVVYILIKSKRIITDLILIVEAVCVYVSFCMMPGFFIESLFGSKYKGYTIQGMEFKYADITMLAMLFILLLFVRKILKNYPIAKRPNWTEFVLSILLIVGDIVLTACVLYTVDFNTLFGFIWGCIVIAAFIAFFALFVYRVTKNKVQIYQKNEDIIKKQYDALKLESLLGYKDREEMVRKMRHDFLNHIAVIDGLCDKNDIQGIKEYVSTLQSYSSNKLKFSTGNDITDVVINRFGQAAEDKGIAFSFEGSVVGWDFMSGPDMSGILINAINNAIEACEGKENQYIDVIFNETDYLRSLVVKNPVSKKKIILNNSLKTTKDDKENHGYGLAIIEQIVNKYQGSFKISSTDSEFILAIMIKKKATA